MKNVAMKDIERIALFDVRTGKLEEIVREVRMEEEWKKILTPDEFKITQKKGTEPAFHNKYHDFKGKGIYEGVGCGTDLFRSDTKYDSGTAGRAFGSASLNGTSRRKGLVVVHDSGRGALRAV